MSALSDESAPLIRTESQVNDIDEHTQSHASSHAFVQPLSRRDVTTLLLTFAVFFLLCFAKFLVEVPIVQLFEQTACHQFYRARYHAPFSNVYGSVFGGYDCKVPPVQDKLAKLVGWRIAFDAIPGLLTAIAYGFVADTHGRKIVLWLSCLGGFLSLAWIVVVCYASNALPVELVWLSSLSVFLGGGDKVLFSMVVTIVADTVDKAQRSRYMYIVASISPVTTLTAPFLAAFTMEHGIFLPFEVALALRFCAVLTIPFIPETLGHKLPTSSPPVYQDDSEDRPSEDNPSTPEPDGISTHKKNIWTRLRSPIAEIGSLFLIPKLLFCFSILFFRRFALTSASFIYQYASVKLGWGYEQTTYLRICHAVGASIVTLLLLPYISKFLTAKGFHIQTLDLNIVRASSVVLTGGFLLFWRATAPCLFFVAIMICGLGSGLEPATQGLATKLIDPGYNARMFTTVAVLDTLAKLLGGPLAAALYSIRPSAGEASSGFNFLGTTIVFGLMAVAAFVMRVDG